MKGINSKSMIVVVAGLGLVALGFLSYRKMVSKENEKKPDETPQPSVEASKTENVNDATSSQEQKSGVENKEIYDTTGDADRLVKEIILDLLNKDCKYNGHDHFMGEFIRISVKNIIDPRWFERLPKDTNEMISVIKTYGDVIYKQYERKVLGITSSGYHYNKKRSSKQRNRKITLYYKMKSTKQ